MAKRVAMALLMVIAMATRPPLPPSLEKGVHKRGWACGVPVRGWPAGEGPVGAVRACMLLRGEGFCLARTAYGVGAPCLYVSRLVASIAAWFGCAIALLCGQAATPSRQARVFMLLVISWCGSWRCVRLGNSEGGEAGR
jgi:hypothetical protein